MKKILSILLLAAFATGVSAQINPDLQPEPTTPKPIKIGEYHSFTADNGMEVFLVRKAGFPSFRISVDFGIPLIPEEQQPEVRKVIYDIFSNGTKKYPTEAIKATSNLNAASIICSPNTLTCSGLKRDLPSLLPIAANFVLAPNITEKTVAEAVKKAKERLSKAPVKEAKPKNFMGHLRDSLSFSKNKNKEALKETSEGFDKVTLGDVQQYFRTYINPNNSFCMITGDFTEKEANELIMKYFKGWKKGKKIASTYENNFETHAPDHRTIYIVDKENAVQSDISVVWPLFDAFPYSENDPVLMIMNQIFGDGYLSYLNKNIRLDKGLSYGANNILSTNITGGSCNARTRVRTDQTTYALENILYEMLRIRNQLVSKEDFDMAKNGMLGDYARSLSQLNSPAIIGFGMVKDKYKLPNDYLETYPLKIAKITIEDIRNAAQKYINPFECIVLIEGDVKALKGQLEKFGPVEYYSKEGKRIE